MLAYAANRPVVGKREASPNALLLVVSVHVALLAVIMSAKMEMPPGILKNPPLINIPIPPAPPPPNFRPAQHKPQPSQHLIDHPVQPDPIPLPQPQPRIDNGGTAAGPISGGGTGTDLFPQPPKPTPLPVHHDPILLTQSSDLKPPYPASKLASEEEATLHLRLTIDDQGRVTAVDPVGTADRAFLDSARRYILAHWRYRPASDDGRSIGSTIVVTLQFQLDG